MSNTNEITAILKPVVDFVALSSAVAKLASDELNARTAGEKRAQAKVAPLVEKLASLHLIDATEKTAAAQHLSAHDTALDILGNAVERITALEAQLKTAGYLGSPDKPQKNASDSAPGNPAFSHPSFKTDADHAFERRLLGTGA